MQGSSGMRLFHSNDDLTPVYKIRIGHTADQHLVVMPGIAKKIVFLNLLVLSYLMELIDIYNFIMKKNIKFTKGLTNLLPQYI